MTSSSLGYEVREVLADDGGLELELWVEESRVARARASVAQLHDIEQFLGKTRDEIRNDLEQRLQDVLKTQGQFVDLSEPVESPESSLRFISRFVWRLYDELSTGLVWYDIGESVTGPESLPAVVRNKMRHEVLRKLTEPGGTARALIERDGRAES